MVLLPGKETDDTTLGVDGRLHVAAADRRIGFEFEILDAGGLLDHAHKTRIDRIGMPVFAFADGPRGAVIGNATCFPVAMARGATWDPDLEQRVGEAIGAEPRR